MERPQVSIIENQSETVREVSISESEKIALLSKYGFSGGDHNYKGNQVESVNNLTFEEMVSQQEQSVKQKDQEKKRESIPSYSIDQNSVQFYESKYKTFEEDDTFGFEVKIVSDMKIPKY